MINDNRNYISGVYFLDDSKYIRIGCSNNIKDRIRQHRSSNHAVKVIATISTDAKEIRDEENRAFNYFSDYIVEKSFYDRVIKDKIVHYVNDRVLQRSNLLEEQKKRTGVVQTLWGPESLSALRPRCDWFPEQFASIMGKAGTQKGEKPRIIYLEGKKRVLGPKGKTIYQSVVRDTKSKLKKKILKKLVLNNEQLEKLAEIF